MPWTGESGSLTQNYDNLTFIVSDTEKLHKQVKHLSYIPYASDPVNSW